MLRQMLAMFRANIDHMTVEEKRAAIRTLVRKVVWDGTNAHVVLFGADEGELEFPDMTNRIQMDAGEDEDLTPFADVDYEEFDENPDAENKSPWGEGRK